MTTPMWAKCLSCGSNAWDVARDLCANCGLTALQAATKNGGPSSQQPNPPGGFNTVPAGTVRPNTGRWTTGVVTAAPPKPVEIKPPPRAWKIGDGTLALGAYDIFVNGKQVNHVIAYDVDGRICEAYCLRGHSGHAGRKHDNPLTGEPCTEFHHGLVEVRRKETP